MNQGSPQQDPHHSTQSEPPARAARSSRTGNSPQARIILILFVFSPLAVLVVLMIFITRAIDQRADKMGQPRQDKPAQITPDLGHNE